MISEISGSHRRPLEWHSSALPNGMESLIDSFAAGGNRLLRADQHAQMASYA